MASFQVAEEASSHHLVTCESSSSYFVAGLYSEALVAVEDASYRCFPCCSSYYYGAVVACSAAAAASYRRVAGNNYYYCSYYQAAAEAASFHRVLAVAYCSHECSAGHSCYQALGA